MILPMLAMGGPQVVVLLITPLLFVLIALAFS